MKVQATGLPRRAGACYPVIRMAFPHRAPCLAAPPPWRGQALHAGGVRLMKRGFLILACLALGSLGSQLPHSLVQGDVPAAPAVPRELTSYHAIVKKVLPAVVSIEAQAKGGRLRRARPDDMQLAPESGPFFQAPARRVDDQDEYRRVGFGSGFLAIPRGVVVTNNHV